MCYLRGVNRLTALILLLASCMVPVAVSAENLPRPVITGLGVSLGSMRLTGDSLSSSGPENDQGFDFGLATHLVVRREFARYASAGWKAGFRTAGASYTRRDTLPGETEPVERVGRYRVTYLETSPVVRVFTDTRIRFYGEIAPGVRIVPGALRYEETYSVDGQSVKINGRIEPSRRLAAHIDTSIGLEYEHAGIVIDGAFGFSAYSQQHTVPPGPEGFVPRIFELSIGVGYVW